MDRISSAEGPIACSSAAIFHLSRDGTPLCGFTIALAKDWPKGHAWILPDQQGLYRKDQICQHCVRAHSALSAKEKNLTSLE